MPEALDIVCPICSAAVGHPCEDVVVRGWITERLTPHVYRQIVAREVSTT